jgi:hypothetical protein
MQVADTMRASAEKSVQRQAAMGKSKGLFERMPGILRATETTV